MCKCNVNVLYSIDIANLKSTHAYALITLNKFEFKLLSVQDRKNITDSVVNCLSVFKRTAVHT